MSDAVVYEQFEQAGASGHAQPGQADLRRLSEVPLEASVEIGRVAMTVGETLELRAGTVVVLDRLAGEPVDLLVNGTRIAQGEVVVVDEQFGLRVTAVVDGDAAALTASAAVETATPVAGVAPGVDAAIPVGALAAAVDTAIPVGGLAPTAQAATPVAGLAPAADPATAPAAMTAAEDPPAS